MRLRHGLAWLSVAAVAAAAAACRPQAEGTLRAHWTSRDTALGSGDLQVPVKGAWCQWRGRLTLLGVSGDTGVGIVVRTDRLAPGRFVVSDTVAARSHGSMMAFRLANQRSLFNLSSDSGGVALTSVREGRIGGRFVAWFTQSGKGPVLLTGSFAGVSAVPDSVRCEPMGPVAPPPAAVPDSGVN